MGLERRVRKSDYRKKADVPGPVGRLSLDAQRRGEKAPTHHGDEHAPVYHWMISSARPSTDGGIVRPSALAVLRLITSSYFVGCSTGRSAGLAPFRILST